MHLAVYACTISLKLSGVASAPSARMPLAPTDNPGPHKLLGTAGYGRRRQEVEFSFAVCERVICISLIPPKTYRKQLVPMVLAGHGSEVAKAGGRGLRFPHLLWRS